MKRLILIVGVACMLALSMYCTAFAQETAVETKTTSLWKVGSKTTEAYLLGSIHLLKDGDYPLNNLMEKAFDKAEIVVFETDLDSAQAAVIQHRILANAMYPEGRTLQSELDEATYAAVAEALSERGLDIAQLNSLKPWFVALTVTVSELQRMGFDFTLGVDKHFHDKAKAQNKQRGTLETAAFQVDLFISLSEEENEQFLMQTLEQLDDIEKYMDVICTSWKTGDLEKLNQTLNQSFSDYPALYEKFLAKRNRNWVPKIEKYLKGDKPVLFIVGVAHMCGKDSVLDLLAKKGYSIEQVRP